MKGLKSGAQRRPVPRISFLRRHARWLAVIPLSLLGMHDLPAVVVHFLPNYHLEPIEAMTEDGVQNDGRTPAVFKVQVQDHLGRPIKDEPVGWTVRCPGADKVAVWAKITDDKGYSFAHLTSRVEGTFDVTASWRSDNGKWNFMTSTGAPLTVTFCQSQPLTFAEHTVTTDFGQVDANGQVPLQTADGGNGDSSAVSYASSDEGVAVVEDGKLTLKGVGVTCITATEPATPQFTQQGASYMLVVKNRAAGTPSFAETKIECNLGELPPSNALTQGFGGSVSYSSNCDDVAEVDANGKLTIRGAGAAVITAEETKDHCEPASASYIVVVHPLRMERTPSVAMGRHTIQLSGLPKKSASVYLSGALYDTVDTDDKGNFDFALDAFGPETELELYFTQEDNGATLESEKMVMKVDCCAFDSHPLFYRALILKN